MSKLTEHGIPTRGELLAIIAHFEEVLNNTRDFGFIYPKEVVETLEADVAEAKTLLLLMGVSVNGDRN